MKVKKMIEILQNFNPDAEVKLHHKERNNALFVVLCVGNNRIIVIEDKDDNDLRSELDARFERLSEEQINESDFFIELFDSGFTLGDIKENLPEKYEYSKAFCEEHGLM